MVETKERETQIVEGYYHVYRLELGYGGPEEGGWWFDCGTCIALLPHSRECYVMRDEDGEVECLLPVTEDEEPEIVTLLKKQLVETGRGEFDSEYRNVRPRHDSLCCQWSHEKVLNFPTQRPHYE